MKKLLLSSIALSSITLNASAETTNQEFSAINKIASLCQSFKATGLQVAVIKGEGDDAQKIDGYAKSAGLTSSIISLADASSTTANLVIVASDVKAADHAQVATAFNGKKVITVSTNLACVESSKCMLGVDVGSVVKLLVNSQNYQASGLKFDPAFEFMVKQI
jgi:hypothetical protein